MRCEVVPTNLDKCSVLGTSPKSSLLANCPKLTLEVRPWILSILAHTPPIPSAAKLSGPVSPAAVWINFMAVMLAAGPGAINTWNDVKVAPILVSARDVLALCSVSKSCR